ncbi:DUF1266 domain-containing protein [Streptomyces sp. NPDC005393]|uniref:DUF1266 domain-containing protein n=1 Tax=Streptomyces sp. NPDC005393 TaxID=3157041 RepID=UPI0033B17FBB
MGGTNRQEWRRTQELLLGAELISGVREFALGGRRSLALDFAGPVGVDHWRTVAERVLRRNAAESAEVKVTPDGVTTAGPRDIAEVEARITGVQRLIGRIARYEARFRADGLLAEGRFVRSVEAWDYGRASAMARFGLGARYCAVQEAEQAVLHASRVARTAYRSPPCCCGGLCWPWSRSRTDSGGAGRCRRRGSRAERPSCLAGAAPG